MPRRTRTAFTASAAVTALLLTGCGSDNGNSDDEVAGVQNDTEQTDTAEDEPEPEPETEPEDGIERPVIDLGDNYQNVYADDYTGDPVKDAVLRDVQGWHDAAAEAIVSYENDRPALRFYLADEALFRTLDILADIYSSEESSAGTASFFNADVTIVADDIATVSICRDPSEDRTIDFKTGEVVKEADSDAKPSLFVARTKLNEKGVWQTVDYEFYQADEECS